MARYVLTDKAVRGLKQALSPHMNSTGASSGPAAVSIDRYPLPFTVRYSTKESNWVIWLPDPAKLVLVKDSPETITGITACQNLPSGYYTVDALTSNSTAIYLEVIITEESGSTPASSTCELVDSPSGASTGEIAYDILVAELINDTTNGFKRVKQNLTSPVVIPEDGTEEDMDLDEVSIDKNTSDEVEIKGWETGTPAWTNSIGDILSGNGGTGEDGEQMICRQADGTLGFRTIGQVTGGGGGLTGTVNFVADVKYDTTYHQLQQRVDTLDLATGQVTQGQYAMITGGQAVPLP